jgi:hypothetical protein
VGNLGCKVIRPTRRKKTLNHDCSIIEEGRPLILGEQGCNVAARYGENASALTMPSVDGSTLTGTDAALL